MGNRKNAVGQSQIAFEIKKDRLQKHLREVEKTIEEWIPQLSAPDPFASRDGTWGWQTVYQPAIEADTDLNHLIRKHLKSRRLWRLHTEWQYTLNAVWSQLPSLRDYANRHMSQSSQSAMDYTKDFIGTALWQAFLETRRDRSARLTYHPNDPGSGIKLGGYVLERSASSDTELKEVEKKHRKLIAALADTQEMKQIVDVWQRTLDLQSNMHSLATTLIRSNDYLNPCRFCKKLWQA
ncbi:MAG: hypothetical protein HQ553_10110 [Chloroflexi bacterium]|nr:hypothetical protein [Chloroflexota bacterium]